MSAELLLSMAAVGLLGSIVGAFVLAGHLRTYPQTAGYLLGGMICLGLVSLGVGAYALGELPGGPGTVMLLVLIYLIVQPLCLLLFVGGAYKMAMALGGRVTYAFRTAPPGEFSPEEYRSLRTHCITSGAVGVAFSVGLAFVCLRPLL